MVRNAAEQTPNDRGRERQREILRAASAVFRRKGLHATGMRDIAAELGMAVGNLYYYFASRDALLAFCQEDGLDGLLALAAEVRSLAVPLDVQLHLLVAGHVVLLNEGTPGSLAHLEIEALPAGARSRVVRRRQAYEGELRALLTAGVADGAFRADLDPKVAAMAVLGAVNWTAKWFRPGGGRSAREIGEQFATQLVAGVLAPGRRATAPAPAQLAQVLARIAPVEASR
jgi:AcrR family transcriptional regulator